MEERSNCHPTCATATAWTAMQEMTSTTVQNSQHPDTSAYNFRKTLNDLILTMFELPRSNEDLVKLFSCISHCMEEFPQIFVIPSHAIELDGVTENELSKRRISLAFTKWLISRVFHLLSSQNVPEYHNHCTAVLISVWKLLESHDLKAFQALVTDLVLFSNKINEAKLHLGQQKNCKPIDVNCFFIFDNEKDVLTVTTLNLVECPITLADKAACENLQVQVLNVVIGLINGITQFVGHLIPPLWIMLCRNIEEGSYCLKKLSFDAVQQLISSDGVPRNLQILGYLIDCTVSCLEYMYSPDNIPRDFTDFEVSIGPVFQELASQIADYNNKQRILKTLFDIMPQIKSPVLQKNIGNSIYQMISRNSETVAPWRESLVKFTGKLTHSEWLIKSIGALVIHEAEMQQLNMKEKYHQPLSVDVLPIWERLLKHLDGMKQESDMLCCLQSTCEILTLGIYILKEGYSLRLSSILLRGWKFRSSVFSGEIAWSPHTITAFYRLVIQYSGLLMNSKGISDLEQCASEFNDIVTVLSLPWIFEAVSLFDLPDMNLHLNAALKSLVQTSLGNEDKMLALPLLAALPIDVALHWRMHIFSSVINSKHPVSQTTALRFLPVLLHILGREHFNNFEMSLRSLCDGTLSVVKGIASVCDQIYCVMARSSMMNWCSDKLHDGYFEFHLICASTDTTVQVVDEVTDRFNEIWTLLLCHQDVGVRLEVASKLDHILKHTRGHSNLLNLCLSLLEDKSFDVRRTFSKCMPAYLTALRTSNKSFEGLVSQIKATYLLAKGQGNWRLQQTVLLAIGNLGKNADGDLLPVIIIILLENLLSPVSIISATASLQLKDLALTKQVKPNRLFIQFRRPLSEFLFDALHESYERGNAEPLNVLKNIVRVFDFTDVKSILGVIVPFLLPHLVIKASVSSTALIRCLAKELQMNKRELLALNFKYIFCHLVCNCSTKEMEKALSYVQNETEIEIGSLLRCDCQRIYNELLLHIGGHYEQVFSGLIILASKDECFITSEAIAHPEEMAEFLQPRLLGFLAFFDSQILNSNYSPEDKQAAVESLIAVIKLMGPKHITPVRMKVMTTLRILISSKDPKFLHVCCKAWDAFVHNLNITVVGPMLSQIIVTILQLLEMCLEGVLNILTYLIVVNQETLSVYFSDLYFIPEVPELNTINMVLKRYQDRPSSQGDLQVVLHNLLRGIQHENLDVRIHALTNLQHVITSHQETIQLLIIGNDSVDPLITQLVDTLLIGCGDADPKVRNLLGFCLGELGAIDPGRLDMKNSNHCDDRVKVYDDIDDDNFVVDLVCGLSRGFLGAVDTRTQDCSSYAIQEILQVYECTDSKDTSCLGGRLWKSFPEHVQEIIAPLLHSRYMPSKVNVDHNAPQPIFCSSKGLTFHDWIKNWAEYLITKVNHPKAKRIFCACCMIIRHDVSIALFLLPLILVYVLIEAHGSDMNIVSQEILAVLTHSDAAEYLHPDLHHMSVQAVFSVLDYLRRWLGRRTAQLSSIFTRATTSTADVSQPPQDLSQVEGFLDMIPKDVLAKAAYKAQGYSRALMNLEAFIKCNPQLLQEQLGFLQILYQALDEPDGVIGVNAIRQETSLLDQILSHESSGQHLDARSCYERAIQINPSEISLHQGLLRCLMDLDELHTALAYTNGILAERSNWISHLNHYRVEAAWKLANWEVLDSYLNCIETSSSSWDLGIGKILCAMKSKNKDLALKHLDILRSEQMVPLSAASMESGPYQRGYEHIMRLHMLDELGKGMETFFGHNISENQIRKLLAEWKNRKQFVQSSMRYLGPMLNLRRVILEMAVEDMDDGLPLSKEFKQEIGRCWLYSAKIARKYGHLQRAYSSLLTASNYLSSVCLEQAKWHWQKGEQEQAILCLQKVVKDSKSFKTSLISEISEPGNSTSSKLAWAKTKLLLAKYMEESSNLDSDSIIKLYNEVSEINQEWEDGHFFLAQFLDRILSSTERRETRSDMIIRIVKHFGTSLLFGCRYIYQSMPKMLSLWLEFGTTVAELEKHHKTASARHMQDSLHKTLTYLHSKLILPFVQKLPPYLFLTAFSQLISRICHSQPDVFRTLKEIIAKLLVTYPQQSMWMMMAVSKSTYQIRVRRCEEIFSYAQAMSPKLIKFLSDATKLTDRFLELCNKKVEPGIVILSINSQFRHLVRLLEDKDFSQVLLPRQASIMVTLPTGPGSHLKHEPFLHSQVYISGIRDTVELMPSLQRPKKISLRGSDGKFYDMMCKPKDDLRKDCRLMEFNSVVNKFLLKDAESRRRQLQIRTYAVVPLNEECGLIEWVPNLAGLRNILNKIYKEKKKYTDAKQLKLLAPSRNTSIEQKIEIFKNQLLPRFPPVFSEWFTRTFPDSTTWYLARLSYARTTAVMSMIGYILGLGDRHGENILFDSSCGDTVHVDFNCLFNKGETFDWPELVPFRLTHNMVEAMGPLGYEGIYRKSCEVTLKVMRKQLDTLMSLLKPFIHDPLLEWSCTTKAGGSRGNVMVDQGEINNEKAMVHVQDIELRLKGVIRNKATKTTSTGMPLSIEGQVNFVIQEATDLKNLSQMYIGWAAYM